VEGKHFVGNGKAQLTQLKLYPEQKHEEFDAVHSPLPWIPIVPTDKLKFKVSDHQQDVGAILTSQPYVYRSKLKWYILHPEQIEISQLHQSKWWWWCASVFHEDGKCFVGNGNHPVCAALLLGFVSMGLNDSGVEPQICATTLKIKGLWVNCLSRGHGRNVARYGANVRPFYDLTRPEIDAVRA
jgi:hypothetical protein